MVQLLPDIPPASTEQTLSQLRSPLRQDPTGPTRSSTLPATLSPPPTSRRPQLSAPASRSPYQADDRDARRTSYDTPSAYQLPIHNGPPSGPAGYSPSASGSAPVSPYTSAGTGARRGYSVTAPDSRTRTPDSSGYARNGHSQSLPPPPVSYNSNVDGRTSHDARRDNPDPGYDEHYYIDPRSRGAPAFPPPNSGYGPPSGYPLPSPSGGYYIPPGHRYQTDYSHGNLQFEQEQIGGQQPRRRRGNLPRDTTDILKAWFGEHLAHPYPTEDEKQMLCNRTGLAMTQVSNADPNSLIIRLKPAGRSAIGSSMPGAGAFPSL